MTGTITRALTTRGFGFIWGDDGREYMMHAKEVADGQQWESLQKDQRVTFEPQQSGTGGNRWRAIGVLLWE